MMFTWILYSNVERRWPILSACHRINMMIVCRRNSSVFERYYRVVIVQIPRLRRTTEFRANIMFIVSVGGGSKIRRVTNCLDHSPALL